MSNKLGVVLNVAEKIAKAVLVAVPAIRGIAIIFSDNTKKIA